ncbi:MAG: NAD(P)-dependent alcohol dehydrogenase [Candidatus Aminicenantes bacterium]|nr:NAD(P)-dependent alcohol dehydrogenase [Candidatus Aminicenantes bacterium]
MKAIVYRKYGSPDVLNLEDVDKPVPKDDEVLIAVRAAALNRGDWRLMRGKPFMARMAGGLFKPRKAILGADVAGRIEAIGRSVRRFKPGDEVFADITFLGSGGFAEYTVARESLLALKPAGLTFEQAAAVPMAAVTALQGLRDKERIRPGQKVLIHGASGGVGTFAIQLAKVFGAEVTAVCGPGSQELARSLGADRVLDYTREDFARDGRRYDLILAVNGDRSLSEYKRALAPEGIYVAVGGSNRQIFQAMFLGPLMSIGRRKKMGILAARPSASDLDVIKGFLEAGTIRSVIDRSFPLSEGAEAMRYLDAGHVEGKIVLTM